MMLFGIIALCSDKIEHCRKTRKDHSTPDESTRKRTPFFANFWVSKKVESPFDAHDNSISNNK
jgi:hypothetical protein